MSNLSERIDNTNVIESAWTHASLITALCGLLASIGVMKRAEEAGSLTIPVMSGVLLGISLSIIFIFIGIVIYWVSYDKRLTRMDPLGLRIINGICFAIFLYWIAFCLFPIAIGGWIVPVAGIVWMVSIGIIIRYRKKIE